jgi:type IV secretory pathway TraG/TraD family ATPase VirD4
VVQAALRGALERGGTDAVVLERYLFEGNHWLDPVTTGGLPDAAPDALSLGRFPSGGDYWYPHRESLVTIAGPGTGKSSSLMLRNLLRLGTGAIVLDIKGEAYAASADWRSRNVGPVMHFSPDRPNHSVCYNPLDSVGNDLRTVWSEARRLAELLTVPVSRGDQFFEQRAKTLIAAAVATVALTAPLSDRNMRAVLRYLYLSASKPSVEDSELAGWVEQVRPLGVEVLASEVRALVDAPEKQREAVFESARNQLSAWWDDNISAITRVTMVNAKVLREQRGTLFICIRLEDIAPLRSVLRAVIGGLMRELMQDGPETKAETVTLFLDELPQLGRLDVVDQALAVGRGYGIRLWLFAQDTGQLRTIYENADGMMERCRVRIFMNPSEVDAIAMSRWLGERRGLLDGERKALAEPYTLSGPEFRDDVIVFQRSTLPARLRKVFPWDDRETAPRMGTAQTSREPPSVGSSE